MNLGRIAGFTRVCGAEQGYQPLYLRDDTIHDPALGYDVNAMVSRWEPTLEERARIAAGEAIYLRQEGSTPQPVMIGVGDPKSYGW